MSSKWEEKPSLCSSVHQKSCPHWKIVLISSSESCRNFETLFVLVTMVNKTKRWFQWGHRTIKPGRSPLFSTLYKNWNTKFWLKKGLTTLPLWMYYIHPHSEGFKENFWLLAEPPDPLVPRFSHASGEHRKTINDLRMADGRSFYSQICASQFKISFYTCVYQWNVFLYKTLYNFNSLFFPFHEFWDFLSFCGNHNSTTFHI